MEVIGSSWKGEMVYICKIGREMQRIAGGTGVLTSSSQQINGPFQGHPYFSKRY
jgi:hypothetical protein